MRAYRAAERTGRPGATDLVVTPYAAPGHARAVIASLPPGATVQALEAGVDALLDAVPPGVTLCCARGVHDTAVAEWVLAVVLASLRRLPAHHSDQLAGRWRPAWHEDLAGKRVLLIGYGAIGRAVERRLDAFGALVTRLARTERADVLGVARLAELLPDADIAIVLVPLTPETRGLLDRDMLARLPDGALLVNASRGPILATDALVAELEAGRLRAALDVTDPEPLPAGHPLWRAPNVIVTPHVASDTTTLFSRAARLIAEQARRLAAGEPLLHVVRDGY